MLSFGCNAIEKLFFTKFVCLVGQWDSLILFPYFPFLFVSTIRFPYFPWETVKSDLVHIKSQVFYFNLLPRGSYWHGIMGRWMDFIVLINFSWVPYIFSCLYLI